MILKTTNQSADTIILKYRHMVGGWANVLIKFSSILIILSWILYFFNAKPEKHFIFENWEIA